jgi:hypothetical protein
MAHLHATAAAVVNAPSARVYGILADYRGQHPRILPPAFGPLEVEEGGVGAGTVVRTTITAAGRKRPMRMAVTEPEPGQVLVETDLDNGAVTTFTVQPVDDGARAHVSIVTEWSTGGRGFLERLTAPRFLRGLYAAEIKNLERVASEDPGP